jgi:hypothetical protein
MPIPKAPRPRDVADVRGQIRCSPEVADAPQAMGRRTVAEKLDCLVLAWRTAIMHGRHWLAAAVPRALPAVGSDGGDRGAARHAGGRHRHDGIGGG